VQDCCVAAQNLMLEAADLGIGSIYIAKETPIHARKENRIIYDQPE